MDHRQTRKRKIFTREGGLLSRISLRLIHISQMRRKTTRTLHSRRENCALDFRRMRETHGGSATRNTLCRFSDIFYI